MAQTAFKDNIKYRSYKNLLKFTIISAIVSLVLLGLMFSSIMQPYLVFIITLEVGIFGIIVLCIYKIVNSDKKKEKAYVSFDQCPDYYVHYKTNKGNIICANQYIARDVDNNQYVMKLYPITDYKGDKLKTPDSFYVSNGYDASKDEKYDKFLLKELESSTDLLKDTSFCDPLFNPYENATFKNYNVIPWTYAKSRCEGYDS